MAQLWRFDHRKMSGSRLQLLIRGATFIPHEGDAFPGTGSSVGFPGVFHLKFSGHWVQHVASQHKNGSQAGPSPQSGSEHKPSKTARNEDVERIRTAKILKKYQEVVIY